MFTHIIKNRPVKYIMRSMLILFTTLLLIAAFLYGVMRILTLGPSPTAAKLFVMSVRETSAVYWLADLFYSKDDIAAFYATDAVNSEPEMDASLISLPSKVTEDTNTENIVPVESSADETTAPDTQTAESLYSAETSADDTPKTNDGIEIIDITGSTYYGKLMIVTDPTRVLVGVPDNYGEGYKGLTVMQMTEKYGCVAGMNAGGFNDPNGNGTGAIPDGIVISDGKLLWGESGSNYNLAGIDGDGLLHVGTMSASHALDIGIQYAASYGPALVINGIPCNQHSSLGGGLNPRTVIGQRADGAMLLLVINGRQINSLGATLDDLVEIMLKYDAVNATNLDGGSSSLMIYNDECITDSAYVFGVRAIPTAILVKK